MKRPTVVLAGAVVLCLPMASSVIHGGVSSSTALERFLIALVVSWVVTFSLGSLIGRYANQARRAEILRQIEEARAAGTRALDAASGPPPESAKRVPQAGAGP